MRKRFLGFMLFFITLIPAMAAVRGVDNRFIDNALYKNIYPSTLNGRVQNAATTAQMTSDIKMQSESEDKFDTKSQNRLNAKSQTESDDTSDVSAQGTKSSKNRGVVKRNAPMRTASRNAGTNSNYTRSVVPRANSSTTIMRSATSKNSGNRRVVTRSITKNNSGRSNNNTTASNQTKMSSQLCFANYKECMDRYCERSDVAYNRCYCSAKLAKIDSKYQNKIDSLVQEIIKLKYDTDATDAEIKSYWDATVGVYTRTNPWVNIDNALNIDWATTESRVRGQNAFTTGHSYCVNYLRACSYMSSNLRDAYKSEIERDCATYEKGLNRIQVAAESVIESYKK